MAYTKNNKQVFRSPVRTKPKNWKLLSDKHAGFIIITKGINFEQFLILKC